MASETPIFFKVKWFLGNAFCIRRSKAGGMHLANPQELKTCKGLKPPAARLAGTVHPVLSRLIISLEKNGGLRCLESRSVTYAKT
jgi:hypothetical protein